MIKDKVVVAGICVVGYLLLLFCVIGEKVGFLKDEDPEHDNPSND